MTDCAMKALSLAVGPNGYWANVRSAIKRIRNKFRAFDPTFQEIETRRPSATVGASRIDRAARRE